MHPTTDAQPPQLAWLYGTQLFGIKLGLDNVHKLLRALDLPPPGMCFIHVAGTNGKGSTCAFIHSILREAGINAGLFTSPHLIRFNERIRDAEREITDAEIEAGLTRMRGLISDWQPHPTFFEIAFALALDWFRQRGCQWVVLETGLGGRLDATNVVVPRVSVITAVGRDHMNILGDTLGAIAAEKAGIIKPGIPVITQAQVPEAHAVLAASAFENGAPLTVFPPLPEDSGVALAGPHQLQNAALAVAALRAAGHELPLETVRRGLRSVHWLARFQRLEHGRVIVDGAHNRDGVLALVSTWEKEYPGEKAIAIVAMASDKEIPDLLRTLSPIVSEWRFTSFQGGRAAPPESLLAAWQTLGLEGAKAQTSENLSAALPGTGSDRILIAGSLYLAGEALAHFFGKSRLIQTSLQ